MRWWVVGVVVSESSDSASAIDEVSALFIAAKRDTGEERLEEVLYFSISWVIRREIGRKREGKMGNESGYCFLVSNVKKKKRIK